MSMFLIARLGVQYGQVAQAAEILAEIVPIAERNGWKLLAAYQTVIGDFSEIIDIWEVPDANIVPRTLSHMFADPGFTPVFDRFRKVIRSEHLSLHTKLPFSP